MNNHDVKIRAIPEETLLKSSTAQQASSVLQSLSNGNMADTQDNYSNGGSPGGSSNSGGSPDNTSPTHATPDGKISCIQLFSGESTALQKYLYRKVKT